MSRLPRVVGEWLGVAGWLLAPSLVDTTSRGMDMMVGRDHLRVPEVSALEEGKVEQLGPD